MGAEESEIPETPEEAEANNKCLMESLSILALKNKIYPIIEQLDCSDKLKMFIKLDTRRLCNSYVLEPNSLKESLIEFEKKMEKLIEDEAIRKKLVNDVTKKMDDYEEEQIHNTI